MRLTRIWFAKSGRAKYISHLDLYRTFTRAVNRAHLPLWFTEGFNTHPYITFALPLSIMQESDMEAVDIRIVGEMTNQEIKKRLSEVMPEGISILDVRKPFNDPKEIMYAQYMVTLEFSNSSDAENFKNKAEELLNSEELLAEKMGKKNGRKTLKQVDLLPMIFKSELSTQENIVKMLMTVSAGSTTNLNPTLFVEAVSERLGISPEQTNVKRKQLLVKNFEYFE